MPMDAIDLSALVGLFAAAFLAATLVPAQSEAVLAAMVVAQVAPTAVLIAVASVGNIAGSCVNWWLGVQIERFRGRTWFPVSERSLQKAQSVYSRWGWPSLVLSWVPVIGDPLTLVAGVMREPFWRFLLIVAVAKTTRYLMLIYLIGSVVD